MANFYVTHHKFPTNPQLFTITLYKVAGFQPEENPNFQPTYAVAEPFWKIFIYTTGLDSNGDSLEPIVADIVGTAEDVSDFVDNYLAILCDRIDWSQQGEFSPETDVSAPVIVEQYPAPSQVDVPISSPIVLRVKDLLPGTGIDPSTVVMVVDGYTVTPTFVGNKYDYTFSFKPKPIFNE